MLSRLEWVDADRDSRCDKLRGCDPFCAGSAACGACPRRWGAPPTRVLECRLIQPLWTGVARPTWMSCEPLRGAYGHRHRHNECALAPWRPRAPRQTPAPAQRGRRRACHQRQRNPMYVPHELAPHTGACTGIGTAREPRTTRPCPPTLAKSCVGGTRPRLANKLERRWMCWAPTANRTSPCRRPSRRRRPRASSSRAG